MKNPFKENKPQINQNNYLYNLFYILIIDIPHVRNITLDMLGPKPIVDKYG